MKKLNPVILFYNDESYVGPSIYNGSGRDILIYIHDIIIKVDGNEEDKIDTINKIILPQKQDVFKLKDKYDLVVLDHTIFCQYINNTKYRPLNVFGIDYNRDILDISVYNLDKSINKMDLLRTTAYIKRNGQI